MCPSKFTKQQRVINHVTPSGFWGVFVPLFYNNASPSGFKKTQGVTSFQQRTRETRHETPKGWHDCNSETECTA